MTTPFFPTPAEVGHRLDGGSRGSAFVDRLATARFATRRRRVRRAGSMMVAGLVVASSVALTGGPAAADASTDVPDRIAASGSRCFGVSGAVGDLAVVNVTPVRASGPGFGWLSSSGDVSAGVSNVNYGVGRIDPNVAVARIGADQQVCFHNSDSSSVHLVADQLATIAGDAATSVVPRRVIDTRSGGPVTFDVATTFGDVDPEALAVTSDGRVVVAAGAQLLVRDRDGGVVPIDLPAGIEVSRSWVGTDAIAVAWSDDRGVEVDLDTGVVVSTLARTSGMWNRTVIRPAEYRVLPGRPFNSLRLDLLVRAGTQLPEVEGAGCSELLSIESGQSWLIQRPAECSGFVDEIASLATGGYVVTLSSAEADDNSVHPYVLRPDGAVEALAVVASRGIGFDTQPGPDGLTILTIEGTAATVEHIAVP